MKKIFAVVSSMLLMFVLFGCKTDNSAPTTSVLSNQEFTKKGTLQGKIMNATTGAAIGNDQDSELKVWLIQGTDNRTPSKLVTDNNNPLVGEYAFSGIPVDLYKTNATFKVVVSKTGFQRFEADVELNANSAAAFTNTLDETYNMIGNIYLFPEAATAADLQVNVFSPTNTVVPNAIVTLVQDVENNGGNSLGAVTVANAQGGLNPNGDRLKPTGGLYTTMTATTDSTGVATFAGAKLVLGGQYLVHVASLTLANGAVVADPTAGAGTAVIEDSANVPVYITMLTKIPATLYATTASNEVPGTLAPTGVLSITFNEPIVITTTWFGANLIASNGTISSNPAAIGAVSADGLTLTITPVFSTAPTATAAGARVTYTDLLAGSGGTIFIKSTQTAGPAFNAIPNKKTGAFVSTTVQMISF